MKIPINVIAFQIGWFACVLGAAYAIPMAGTAIALTIVLLHVLRAPHPWHEAILAAIAVALGALLDSSLMMGLVQFKAGVFVGDLAPPWMLALWTLLPITLNISMRWLKGRVVMGALFGAIGGPLAYYAGQRLGALQLIGLPLALTVLALGWAIAVPVLVRLSQRFDGYAPSIAERISVTVTTP